MTKNNTVLVTGGAGYIGSYTAHQLIASGAKVVVVDNLYSGHLWAVPKQALFYEGDAGDQTLLGKIFNDHKIDSVIHFAGHIVVPESASDPLKYYRNNVVASQALVSTCLKHKVAQFIFSSSAAVYGIPKTIPVNEQSTTEPINPYGASKLISEWLLRDVAHTSTLADSDYGNFRYVALRYFNVAGAHPEALLGQATPDATHLIKVASEAVCGLRDSMTIYGTDYETEDGTCIRDYIHIEDLANAHLAALRYLNQGGQSNIFNCGYGQGFSVKQVLETVQNVSGINIMIIEGHKRAGDPPSLIADNARIRATLDWTPEYQDLELICKTAVQWEKKISAIDLRGRQHSESL